MKNNNCLNILAILLATFFMVLTTEAAELTVYGKGGVSGGHGSGGTTVKICPESSTDKCATLTIDINELKIDGEDGNVIVISRDDISILLIPKSTAHIQGESIKIELKE